MAKADVIAKALFALEEAFDQQRQLLDVLAEVGGDRVPAWVLIVARVSDRVRGPLDALGDALRSEALPYLRDLDGVKLNGGMGAVAPMATKVSAGELITSRK